MKLPRRELKRARIEIIPMIDTIFFLLVFFMIASLSLIQMSAKRVDLPHSSTAQDKPHDKIVLSLDAAGHYFVDRQPIALAQILPIVSQRVKESPSATIVLNCDRRQKTGPFLQLMEIAKKANPNSLVMATSPTANETGQ